MQESTQAKGELCTEPHPQLLGFLQKSLGETRMVIKYGLRGEGGTEEKKTWQMYTVDHIFKEHYSYLNFSRCYET